MLNTGRRWGKTIGGANDTLQHVLDSEDGSVTFIVAPTYWHTQKCWKEISKYLPGETIQRINRTRNLIVLYYNKEIYFKSAEDPYSLRSEGLSFLWVDECAEVKEEAWILALRPALMDKHGKAIFTTTPKGHNWFYQLWSRGQDPEHPDYESWLFPSISNPYLDPKEIEAFAKDMPEFAYRQEILGEFMEDVGSVFRGVDQCVTSSLSSSESEESYVLGVDLAKHQDFTVIAVIRQSDNHLVHLDRFGELDWNLQKKRIVAKAQQYNTARILLDSTGVGDPIYDDLRRSNLTVTGYKFTNASKADLVENLSIMIEQGKISFPNIPELINELKLFSYTQTSGGTIRYGAPEGYHDDCVIALGLAAWLNRTSKIDVGSAKIKW